MVGAKPHRGLCPRHPYLSLREYGVNNDIDLSSNRLKILERGQGQPDRIPWRRVSGMGLVPATL